MSVYAEIDPQNDPATIEREINEALEARWEGWEAPAGSLIDFQIKTWSRLISITRGMAAEMRVALFKSMGEKIVGVPQIGAAPATATSTWTLSDEAGHTIPAGTKVTIAGPNDVAYGFEVVTDVVVPPASAKTGVGAVALRAVVPGAAANELSADPVPSTSYTFIESIALVGETANGVDEEDEDHYLNRLTEDFSLLSLSLVKTEDFAKDARSVAGIERCLVIPGYNPETKTEGNLTTVCDFPIDAAGANLSAERKAELQARQQAKVPSGVLIFVADPKRIKVDGKTEFTVLPGYVPGDVKAAVAARLADYFSPAKWGAVGQTGQSPAGAWKNATHVYYFEVVSEIDRVPGVDRVISLEIAKHEAALGKVDLTLEGPAPLAEFGTWTLTTA